MKKFLKWSAAFLLIGVLAVSCVKTEPSAGIEQMRMSKAALLDANAQLTLAKVQVEAAKAAVLQAKATLLLAEAERVKAKAQVELANADLITAKAEHVRAANDYLKQKWALKIAELELALQEYEAAVQSAIKTYEKTILDTETLIVDAQKAYETALLQFEEWKLEHANVLTELQLGQLDDIIEDIQDVTLAIAYEQVRLNTAKAAYSTYVNVVYPYQTEEIAQDLEQEIRVLTCAVEDQEALVAVYTAMYNNYHGEFDAFIDELQAKVAEWEETIVQLQLAALQAEKDVIDLYEPMMDAYLALTAVHQPKWTVQAWEAGNFVNDADLDVDTKGVYTLARGPIGGVTLKGYNYVTNGAFTGQIDEIREDIALIEDTRAEFEGQGAEDVEAIKKTYEDAAKKAKDAYTNNWNTFQKNYAAVQPGTGSLYTKWAASYADYNKQVAAYKKNAADYKALYEAAVEAVSNYMDGMNNQYKEGTLGQYLGSTELSAVLGGITFNASALLEYIWGGTLIYPALDAFLSYLSQTDKMNAYALTLKNVMDGTFGDFDPFWTVAQAHSFISGTEAPIATAVMPGIYTGETGKTLNDLTVADYHKWLFLYWLFEDKTLSVGMNGFDAFFQVNPNSYTDATAQFMRDFFGKYDAASYAALLKVPSTDIYSKDMKNYEDAVAALSTLEATMFSPFNRTWSIEWKINRAADPSNITAVVSDPDTYTAPAVTAGYAAEPDDAEEFFFKIEGLTEVYPSLDLTETYLGEDCNLWVSYSALLAAGDYCYTGTSTWAGDMMLYPFSGSYKSGHFFAAIKAQRVADSYITKYNHVINGEYEKLQAALEAKLDELVATREALWAAFDEAYAAYDEAIYYADAYKDSYIPYYEDKVVQYNSLIKRAQVAHSEGLSPAEDGIAESLAEAEDKLLELQQRLAALQTNLDNWNAGYGIFDIDRLRRIGHDNDNDHGGYTTVSEANRNNNGNNNRVTPLDEQYWQQYRTFLKGFIPNLTAIYTADIDVILLNISNLYAHLEVLEAQRAAIAAAIGVTIE